MKSTSWLLLFIQTGEAGRVSKPAAASSSWFPPMFLQGEEQELLPGMLTESHSGRQSVRPQKKQWKKAGHLEMSNPQHWVPPAHWRFKIIQKTPT
jgi:gentisate 1,2-dioxygenase